jgi:hypothetical protein
MKGIGNCEPTAPVCAGIGLVGEQVQLFLGRLVLKFGFLFLRGIFLMVATIGCSGVTALVSSGRSHRHPRQRTARKQTYPLRTVFRKGVSWNIDLIEEDCWHGTKYGNMPK